MKKQVQKMEVQIIIGSNHNNELISETDKNTTSKEQKQLVKLLETIDNKNNLKESKNSAVYIPNPNSDKLDIYGSDDKSSNYQDNKDDSKKDNSNKDDCIYKNGVPKEINEEQPSNQKKKEKEKEKENTIESSIRRIKKMK